MFQNKPTLFYLIDYNDTIDFEEKMNMKNLNDPIYFGNIFLDQNKLFKKIQYYINKKFVISEELKKKYNSVFFYKNNIRERILKIVNKIIDK